ncbi:MAG: efflux RND transporter periplasmic adaptor subunit [Opitutales bacterium]|nr:efflux RND transporter periplasmic adaptor subunit [Opitutales bacterium]
MNRSILTAMLIFAGLVLYMASGLVFRGEKGAEPLITDATGPPLLAVRVRESAAEPVAREILVTGHTAPNRGVRVRAEVAGRVEAVLAERGSRVSRCDVILRLAEDDRGQRVEEARSRVEQRRQEYEAARRLRDRDLQSPVAVATALAELRAAERMLRQAELDMERTVVRAPFDGVLNERMVEEGDYVSASDPLAHVLDLDPLLVVGEVLETQAPLVPEGSAARARLAGGREVGGFIRYRSHEAAADTRTVRVEMVFPNPGGEIGAGLTANLVVEAERVAAHAVSPAHVSIADDGRFGVKYVDEDDRVRFIEADIVRSTPDALYLGGLPETIRLITVGQGFAMEGDRVDALPEQRAR